MDTTVSQSRIIYIMSTYLDYFKNFIVGRKEFREEKEDFSCNNIAFLYDERVKRLLADSNFRDFSKVADKYTFYCCSNVRKHQIILLVPS